MSVIERSIDGRYQVIARIATGGMGEVYRAQDSVLGREVALKVLHSRFAGDHGFVDRFRREARAAAILKHANVVGVYDWGSTDGTYFMVMEFIQGHNLRALLSRYGRLEPAQAVEVALQVLSALDHAHGHGIVHRDIKPENILIDADGTVKVADFGLARAFADAHVSQAEGTVTGTVQYLGPEQIHGQPAGPRTDLYSLGIVLFEMLTGRAPFTGETSMAIAYQHLSARVPPPSAVIPSTPEILDQAVLHATEKEPDRRPASARAFRDEMVRAGLGLPPVASVAALAAQIPRTDAIPEDRTSTVTIPHRESARAKRMRRLRGVASLVIVLLALVVGGWAIWAYAIPHYRRVPTVAGQTVQEATDRLRTDGLTADVGAQVFSVDVPAGLVLRTDPSEGSRVRDGAEVVLILSKGPELVSVPRLAGLTETEAIDAIERAGFIPGVETAPHQTVPRGRVIDQNPNAGQELRQGAEVVITVSTGPPLVQIPRVDGQSSEDAAAALDSLGFVSVLAEEYSVEVAEGMVIRTEPEGGSRAAHGSSITIVVSLGPRTFAMPDVVGFIAEDAVAQLTELGLLVDVIVVPGAQGNVVVYQAPAANETVREGQTVQIFVLVPD